MFNCSTEDKPYFSMGPVHVDPHLEFIDISEDGYLLLGASNLVHRSWTGSIWYFADADLAPCKDNALTGLVCESAVSCGQFLENREKVIIGEDSGNLSIYAVQNYQDEHVDNIYFVLLLSTSAHDSWVCSLSVNSSKEQTVTAGSDMSINILNNTTMLSDLTYLLAHTRLITCVDCGLEEDIFVSASLDKSALLWDKRLSKPASALYKSSDSGLTSLSWKNEYEIAIGTQTGRLAIVDIRTFKPLIDIPLQQQPIHKLLFNRNGLLAVCTDSNVVTVWDSNTNQLKYINETHRGMVRGLAWHPITNKLYSCGFDKNVFSHDIGVS